MKLRKGLTTIGLLICCQICLAACTQKTEAVISAEGEEYTTQAKKYDNLPQSTSDKFSYKDLTIDGAQCFMTESEVKSIMGEPDKISDNKDIGEKIYFYGEDTLTFTTINGSSVLTGAYAGSDKCTFSRGLKVGDRFEDILDKYYREVDCMNNNKYYSSDRITVIGNILYGSCVLEDLEQIKISDKVEYGLINFNGSESLEKAGSYIVEFTYFEPPYIDKYASVNDDFAQIAFDITSSGVITRIRWYYYQEIK